MLFNELVEQGEGEDLNFSPVDFDSENVSDFIKAFEEGIDKKKVKRKRGIDLFIEDNNEDSVIG